MMERSDIAALSEKILAEMVAHPPSDVFNYVFRVTSGTSGAPLVLVTDQHAEAPQDYAEDGLVRFLSLKGSRSARLANMLVASRVQSKEVRVLALDAEDLMPALADLLADFSPDVINGFCSFIAQILSYISPGTSKSVKRLVLLGEMVSDSFEKTLRRTFPRAQLVEMYMALEAGGYIGNRYCRSLPRGHFHPAHGVTVEIFDKDTEGVGDVLISKSIFRGIQIEKYRIGDIGRIVPGVCACGESVTFELLGRRDIDRIKLGGVLFTREEFDRVTAQFPDLIDDYRVEVERDGDNPGRGRTHMRIYRQAGAGTPALVRELAEKISRALFVTQGQTYRDLVESGVLEPLDVAYVHEAFAQGHKDIKLRLISG